MDFITGYYSSIGQNKQANQDALLIKTADTSKGKVGIFIVCDGMGGLTQGELASATVVRGMSDWFSLTLPVLLQSDDYSSSIQQSLDARINLLNEKIIAYGQDNQVQLGTTITAFLVIDTHYYIVQIGDSRAYVITDSPQQLTEDQSLVAREVARGNIPKEEAQNHPKRHVLLQCIGVNNTIDVVISTGTLTQGMSFLLCTDGFYHKLKEEEFVAKLSDPTIQTKETGEAILKSLVDLVKQRGEVDDISALYIKVS
ncbi:PP2C family protein-serine/threonine phosphatase [Paraliobacillus sediminis]|uniref:PP2C family protein-serine/threonine phosphatase n=1 Tax=Paraliobacillus sediminis TaxID=1885916 RepID=UPI000E3CB595|nr:PP2C family serine/threonine-protein phosphatase [Paraliobacillus sediminis]